MTFLRRGWLLYWFRWSIYGRWLRLILVVEVGLLLGDFVFVFGFAF